MSINQNMLRSLLLAGWLWAGLGTAAAAGVGRDELPKDVRAALEKTVEAYRRARTYQDEGRVEIRMPDGDAANAPVLPSVLRFERPNKVSFDLDVLSIRSNGANMVRFSRRTGQAVGAEAPAVMTPEVMFAVAPGQPDLFVHLKLLMDEDPLGDLLEDTTEVTLAPDEIIDSRNCRVVRFAKSDDQLDATLYIDKETHLVHEFRLSGEGKEGKLPPGLPARVSLQLRNARINEPVPAEAFELPAAASGFRFAVDSPAPPFELQDLQGNNFKLTGLRGKVVVLNFWATWCRPCIDEMPFLQRAHVSYKGKPVEFVGVCTDDRAPVKKIEAVLNRTGVTFRNVLDRTATVQRLYQVPGVPKTVLIDQQGVVRYAHTGFSRYARPNPVDVLTKKIDSLLEN